MGRRNVGSRKGKDSCTSIREGNRVREKKTNGACKYGRSKAVCQCVGIKG